MEKSKLRRIIKSNKYIYFIGNNFRLIYRKCFLIILSLFAFIKWNKLSKSRVIKLELGSAFKGKNGWITVDNTSGANICWDLRKKIPLNSFSVDHIYSSHMLEHIPFKDLMLFLKRCLILLKKDGSFSVCVPSAENYIKAYIEKRDFIDKDKYCQMGLVDTGSSLDQVNYIAYMGGQHNYMFDEENLVNTLKKAGFKNVKIRNFDPQLDFEVRDFESIYAIGYKS